MAIADMAGGDWPQRIRAAAVALTKSAVDDTISRDVMLLEHINEAFGDETHVSTVVLLERLRDRDESPWRDIKGKPLDSRGLAVRLKGYGIRSKTVRIGDSTPKGYDAADFDDAWKRYLPGASDTRHNRHNRHIIDNKNNIVADVADVADGIGPDGDPFETIKDPDRRLRVIGGAAK